MFYISSDPSYVIANNYVAIPPAISRAFEALDYFTIGPCDRSMNAKLTFASQKLTTSIAQQDRENHKGRLLFVFLFFSFSIIVFRVLVFRLFPFIAIAEQILVGVHYFFAASRVPFIMYKLPIRQSLTTKLRLQCIRP